MAEQTISAGNREVIVPKSDSSRVLLEIFGGNKAYLATKEITAGTAGQRLDPGAFRIINSTTDEKHVLYADGSDVTYQTTTLGPAERGQPGVAAPAPGGGGSGSVGGQSLVAKNEAYVTAQNPGANSDILSNDITPSNPGTLEARFLLGSSAVPRVVEDNTAGDLNQGAAVAAGAERAFSVNVSDNSSYNFQVDTAVTVNRLRVTFSRSLNV